MNKSHSSGSDNYDWRERENARRSRIGRPTVHQFKIDNNDNQSANGSIKLNSEQARKGFDNYSVIENVKLQSELKCSESEARQLYKGLVQTNTSNTSKSQQRPLTIEDMDEQKLAYNSARLLRPSNNMMHLKNSVNLNKHWDEYDQSKHKAFEKD